MSRISLMLVTLCALSGCANLPQRELSSDQVLAIAMNQFQVNADRYNIAIHRVEDGWSVSAVPKCEPGTIDPSERVKTDEDAALREIESTTILCAGGDIHLSYDPYGKLTGTYFGQ